MERRQEIQRAVYTVVAVDAAVLFVSAIAFLARPHLPVVLAAVCFLSILIFNFLFLRRRLRKAGPPVAEESVANQQRLFLYLGSVIFIVGPLYGAMLVVQGELPRFIFPAFLVPLSVAVYCLKTARKIGTRKPS